MSAVQFRRYGGPEVLELVTVPRPSPAPSQILVRVEASAVNQHDAVVRRGGLKIITGRRFPQGVGLDFAGTVALTGADVQGMDAGTKVWGMMSPRSRHLTGAAAQYVAVPAEVVARVPAGLSMTDAASLVTTGTTGLRALRDVAHLEPGQRLLVRGGAGAVGMIGVQLGRAMGAHVTALASARDRDCIVELGAHEVLEYRAVTPGQLEPFDVILDTAGTDLLAYRRRLNRSGKMITVAFGSGNAMASIAVSAIFGPKRIRTFSNGPSRRLLDDLAGYVQSGAVRAIVGAVYPLDHIGDAHRALAEPGQQGKLVLITADDAMATDLRHDAPPVAPRVSA